jgi:tetratricopeptide (TPR) repeat protein
MPAPANMFPSSDAPTAPGPLPAASDAPTGAAALPAATDGQTMTGAGYVVARSSGAGPLSVGANFGPRYHIIRLLGIGGMGAVYQAWDQVLEVAVAIKVIRPQAGTDAQTTQSVERRFKRELLLARQVTHKNVVRIHDLGEIDGITYITMPYVQGSDLATILRRDGRLSVDRALDIARQVAAGLSAAHEAGIVHRDLKPANIMVDAEGNALIMDFGIARSTGAGAMTMTVAGAIVGTIEYMAPEQARAGEIDQRADIYAFGLILHDLLLGRRQAGASTAVAELMTRMLRAPESIRSIDPAIPVAIDALVTKCLQPEPTARYQTIAQVLADINHLDADGHALAGSAIGSGPVAAGRARAPKVVWVAASLVLVALAAAAWAWRDRIGPARPATTATATGREISLAILPFRNASNDPSLDSLGSVLSEVLRTELGQSSHVRTVPSDRVHQVLQDLRIVPSATLAPADLVRVADFTTARRVLWGTYTRFGEQIRIDATLQNLDRQESVPLPAMAPNEAGLFTAIADLAEKVRVDLARGSPDVLGELKSSSWKPTTSSFEALRLYNEGLRLTRQGTHQEALKQFEGATKQDASFALGFSALARSYSTLGYDDDAAKFSQQAMSLGEALPPQERYRIAANHYRIINDTGKAIEAYENLVKASPNDAMVQFDLGGLYEKSGDLGQAERYFTQVVQLDPKYVDGLLARGRVEIRRGHFQDSLEHLNGALTLAIQLNNDEARANILQAIGIAYKRLDRPDEALKHYRDSLEIKRKLDNKGGMAGSLGEIAQMQAVLGQARDAEKSYQAAIALQREIGDKNGLSVSLVNLAALLNDALGRPDQALPLLNQALQIRRESGNRSGEATVLNNVGNVYLQKADYAEAQTYFERALQIREQAKVPAELADTLHNLGETMSKLGRNDRALEHYLRALDLRRTAGDKRFAAIESYSIGTIFDVQARYGAAIKSKAEALQTLRDLKQRDVWLGEILGGYGQSLSLGGRMTEAAKPLEEALTLARELKNSILIAHTLRFQAARLSFGGDVKGAALLTEQASQAASTAADRSLLLLTRADVAAAAMAREPTRAQAATFATIAKEADGLGLRSLAVESSVHRAETLLALGDRNAALQEADRAVPKAEAFGFRLLRAKAIYVRAQALRNGTDPGAPREYARVLRILDEIKTEDGSQQVLERVDMRAMHAECMRWAK